MLSSLYLLPLVTTIVVLGALHPKYLVVDPGIIPLGHVDSVPCLSYFHSQKVLEIS